MATWIERNFTRIDVADIDDAKRLLRELWPSAIFCEPIELGNQTITHVLNRKRRFHELIAPDAVIVEEATG